MSRTHNKTISLRIPEDLEQELSNKALVLGMSKSDLVRVAIESILWGTNAVHQTLQTITSGTSSGDDSGEDKKPIPEEDKLSPDGLVSAGDNKHHPNPQTSSPSPSQLQVPEIIDVAKPDEGTVMAIFQKEKERSNPPVEPTSAISTIKLEDVNDQVSIQGPKSRREILETDLGKAFLALAERRHGPGLVAEKMAASLTRQWEGVPGVLQTCLEAYEAGVPLLQVLDLIDQEG